MRSSAKIFILGPLYRLSELPELHFEFPVNLIGESAVAFSQANHGSYSNPGTQVGTQNKDFGTVSQTDQTRVKFCLWHRLGNR